MTGNMIAEAALYAVPLLFGVITHEVAHGWVAEKLGDPTARFMGRITLNPLVHIDPIGTVILPLLLILSNSPFLFGWAKPVPVQGANLRGGRRDMAWVSLAGPLTNLLMACLSALVYRIVLELPRGWVAGGGAIGWVAEPIFRMAYYSVQFNLILMLVNLAPIPPLDGGHALMGWAPESWLPALMKLERFGMLIVLILLGTGLWGMIISPVHHRMVRFFLG